MCFPSYDHFSPVIFTNKVNEKDLKNTESIKLAPVYLQKNIKKKLEIRCTVVGDEIFPAYIDSQQDELGRLDWKRLDLEAHPFRPFKLPAEVADLTLQFVKTLGLHYGALDMILTPDDQYIFLEVNSNGAWGWIERQTGYPISQVIASHLINSSV